MWEAQLDRVPRLGRVGDTQDVDDVLLDLLQRTPVPWQLRWREMVAAAAVVGVRWLTTTARPAGALALPRSPTAWTSRRPAGPGPVPHRVHRQPPARRAARRQGRRRHLVRRRRSPRWLARATRAAESSTCARTRSRCSRRCWPSRPCRSSTRRRRRSSWTASPPTIGRRPASCAGASAPPTSSASRSPTRSDRRCSSIRPRRSPHDRRRVPGAQCTTRWRTRLHGAASARAHRRAGQPGQRTRPVPRRARRARGGAGRRAGVGVPRRARPVQLPPRRLVHVVRQPPASTSSAADRPQGVHVGCYGWVEDLRPDRGPAADSLGYIAAPSLAHAVERGAAAQRPRRPTGPRTRSTSTCRSARVREALKLLEGVAAGQPLAALLGYRIERKLHRRRPRRADRRPADRRAAASPRRRPRRARRVGGRPRRGRRAPAARHAAHAGSGSCCWPSCA